MKNAAIGFRVHSGWAAAVAVYVEDGEPVVLCRKRLKLVEIYNYDFRQPYHTAAKMPLEDGRQFISSVKSQAAKLACNDLSELQRELKQGGCRLSLAALLLASGRPLPSLEHILTSHALIHTADGELFREALGDACAACRLRVCRFREKDLFGEAARALDRTEAALLTKIAKLGQGLGAPWSQDEKFATLAAWLAFVTPKKPPCGATKTRLA